MDDLLQLALTAHGGLERWSRVRSITASLIVSGQLLETKGFPEHQHVTVTVAPDRLYTEMTPYSAPSLRGLCTPDRVWIEDQDGRVVADRQDPRHSFAGHTRETAWDHLHRLYFLGYAMWNYLTVPFIFSRRGFVTREMEPHHEDGEVWRVLEVRFPPDIPAHCETQHFYFNADGGLKRIDYETDVLGGVAAHYVFDPKIIGGLVFPTRRRVVQRTPAGPRVSGITAVLLDYTALEILDH